MQKTVNASSAKETKCSYFERHLSLELSFFLFAKNPLLRERVKKCYNQCRKEALAVKKIFLDDLYNYEKNLCFIE